MRQKELIVALGERAYPIVFTAHGYGSEVFSHAPAASSALIVTNELVAKKYLEELKNGIFGRYKNIHVVFIPDGESHKNWNSLQKIFDALIDFSCDRKTVLFALGGGVVGDVAGFAAASYMRGIPFVQVPTTLLSQVDSSVGGKTAINHPRGKNLIGAFYQPKLVVCNVAALRTLPRKELCAGLAEVIKYGLIIDFQFMEWIEENIDLILSGDDDALLYAVRRSCEIKAQIVGMDERETGMRAMLNFGHTFGHAIEAGAGYGNWLHGEGVAAGMVMAAELSVRLGMLEPAFARRIKALIQRAGLPVCGPILDIEKNSDRYLDLMRLDKKSEDGNIRFVLLDGPGKAVLSTAPDKLVKEVIDDCCA